MASIRPIDCNDAMVHDVMTKAVVRKDHYLSIPEVHDFVVVGDFEQNDETVVESTVAENRIVVTDDALTVLVHVIHHALCDQLAHLCFHVQCAMCKQDFRLTDQCHCD